MSDGLWLIGGACLLAALTYVAGYAVARRELYAAKVALDRSLKLAVTQQRDLVSWIRANWPNEQAAYDLGVAEGYQQGYDHAMRDPRP